MLTIDFVGIGRPRKVASRLKPIAQLNGFNILDRSSVLVRFIVQNSTQIKLASPSASSDDGSVSKSTLYREIRRMKAQNEEETEALEQVMADEMNMMKQMEDDVIAADQVIADQIIADDMKYMQDMEDAAAWEGEKVTEKAENHKLVADRTDEAAMPYVFEAISIPGTPGAVNRHAGSTLPPGFDAYFCASVPRVPPVNRRATLPEKPVRQRAHSFMAPKEKKESTPLSWFNMPLPSPIVYDDDGICVYMEH